jgi:hypothetical protein
MAKRKAKKMAAQSTALAANAPKIDTAKGQRFPGARDGEAAGGAWTCAFETVGTIKTKIPLTREFETLKNSSIYKGSLLVCRSIVSCR